MKRYIKKDNGTKEGMSYWLSIGDLMASILIIFILLFIFESIDVNKKLNEKQQVINELSSVKNKIIAKLKNKFKNESLKIDIDPQTGAIKLDERILFNRNEFKLKPEGEEYLKIFVPKYVQILLGTPEIKKEISQIIIEGHTDDRGTYLYNLNLSQKRAFAVVNFIYAKMDYFKEKEDLKEFITANGRSETKLIHDRLGRIDKDKSRRVEFLFKLKEDEIIKRMGEIIQDKKND